MKSEENSITTSVHIRFVNRSSSAVKLFWVDHRGCEVQYSELHPGSAYNQGTFSTHPWRVRDAHTGAVVCEYVGPTATVTILARGGHTVRRGLVFDDDGLVGPHPEWGAYTKRADVLGIPIKAYSCVSEEAIGLAAFNLNAMLTDVDASIIERLRFFGAEVAIIGRNQVTSDIPAHRHLKGQQCDAGRTFDGGTRGLGGTVANPVTSAGEENLVMEGDRRYPTECILLHEFAHTVMDIGLHGHPLREGIERAYGNAKARSLHPPSSYLMSNACEYWAEASQVWFSATVRRDATGGMVRREDVQQRDPELASLLALVYGDGAWRYTHTAPRDFA